MSGFWMNCPDFSVDVHHPDIELHVEIRKTIYIYSETIRARRYAPWAPMAGPCCSYPAVLTARWLVSMIAKRGVFVDAVYFHAPPYTSERAKRRW